MSASPAMLRRTKLHSRLHFCGLDAWLTALARALPKDCCTYTPGCTAVSITATSEAGSGIWELLSAHNCLPVSGRWRWWGKELHQLYPVLCQQRAGMPAQPRAPTWPREGGCTVSARSHAWTLMLRNHSRNKILSSSFSDPASTSSNPTPLPTRKEASRICFQSSILSLIPHSQLQSWDISSGWGLGKQFSPQLTDIPLLPEPALGATLWLGPRLLFQTPVSYICIRFKSSSWPKSVPTRLFEVTVSIPDSWHLPLLSVTENKIETALKHTAKRMSEEEWHILAGK